MLESAERGNMTGVRRTPMARGAEGVSRGEKRRMKGLELTAKQELALTLIRQSLKERGVPPTRAELADKMGLSKPSSVDKHLIALEKKGWANIGRATSRGIRLLREGAPLVTEDELPAVAAGSPMIAEDRPEPTRLNDFDSFAGQFEGKPDYFVRLVGTSLDKVGLRTGDIMAIRREAQARNGDIVLARIGEDVTLKRYERTGRSTVELQPVSTNAEDKPIKIRPTTSDVEIVGVVVGAIVGTRRETD